MEVHAVEIPEHEKLAHQVQEERIARGKRVLAFIEDYCRQNRCQFIATAELQQQSGGGYVIKAYPGVTAL